MASTIIEDIEGRVTITAKAATPLARGDLVGYDGGWVKADADAATYVYAQFVALEEAPTGGEVIRACRKCTLYDADAPYTANTAQYASGTAGGITETRPATDGDLIQVVGRSLDTYRCRLEIEPPKEYELFITPDTLDGTGEAGLGAADTGWPGPQIDLAGETFYFKGRVPSGNIGTPDIARIIYNSINASGFDNDVTVVAAYDGAANNEDTGTAITAGDWNEDADNKLLYQDVSACLDSGMWIAGRNFAILGDPDGITNDATVIGLYIRGWKV